MVEVDLLHVGDQLATLVKNLTKRHETMWKLPQFFGPFSPLNNWIESPSLAVCCLAENFCGFFRHETGRNRKIPLQSILFFSFGHSLCRLQGSLWQIQPQLFDKFSQGTSMELRRRLLLRSGMPQHTTPRFVKIGRTKYLPVNKHGTQKWCSFSIRWLLGSILNFQGVPVSREMMDQIRQCLAKALINSG